MKKRIGTLITLLLISTSFIACSKDDGGGNKNNTVVQGGGAAVPAGLQGITNPMQGDWYINSITEQGMSIPGPIYVDETNQQYKLKYKVNGGSVEVHRIYVSSNPGDVIKSTFTITNSCTNLGQNCVQLSWTPSGGTAQVIGSMSQNGQNIVIDFGFTTLYGNR